MSLTVQIISASYLTSFDKKSNIKILGHFDNELEALKICSRKKPDIIVLDYAIEKENTGLLIKSFLNESPESKVILLGENLPDEIILSCIAKVIYGYLEWRDVDHHLHRAICSVGNGEAWVSRRLIGLLIENFRE